MGYILALTAVFFWSFNIIIASYFSSTLAPFEIAFGRWFLAALILIPLAWHGLAQNAALLFKHWKLVLGLALTGIVLDNTLIYYAGRTASAVNMGLLDVTGPIFLVILSRIFFKTKISLQQTFGLAVAVFGVVVIILQGNLSQMSRFRLVSGDAIMLANTFCFAVYSLLQSQRPPQVTQSTMLAASVIVGVILIVPFLFTPETMAKFKQIEAVDWLVFIYLGIFNSVLSYLAWNTALSKIGNVKTSIIYYLLPLFSGIEAYFILHENLHWSQLVGGILIIGGIALCLLSGTQKSRL